MEIFNFIIHLLFFFGYWMLIICVTLKILIKRRAVPSVIAWLLIIYIFPIIGVIIYLLLGELNLDKIRTERSKAIYSSYFYKNFKNIKFFFTKRSSNIASSLFHLCEHRQGLKGLKGNNIEILTNIEKSMKRLINDIKLAKKTIHIIFYIWETGGIINKVTNELIEASKRGVSCKIILDSKGSTKFFSSPYPALMQSAGVIIVEALHINLFHIFLRRMDLRQHRKMILIDNYISYTGSMNMVDPRCFKQTSGVGQWIDILLRIEGSVTIAMEIIFSYDWNIETGEILSSKIKNSTAIIKKKSKDIIQIIASGPGYPEGIIHQALLTSLYASKKKLIITTPYLVPSDDILLAICTAAQRGVKVHIIIPKNNHSILVTWASRALFSELLEAGVLIHQFYGGFLHTKSVLIDGQLSLVGTVNLDMRSLWLNFEITLIIDGKNFSHNLEKLQKNYISNSYLIDAKNWSKRPYWQKITEKFFYFFSPLL